ncbi:4-amino-4-deoxychorismate lyase [Caulobacter mirabilis]|uniref:Probable branched-chain-amino-acid aminotransferase n=2 Tax=Caulobacter mirabilis TaxID=69666 RepID=A0A2D2ASG1_9CAUL|nr:4-amino-4-deoxychorismate lyase [Caulobacter mirabilis]
MTMPLDDRGLLLGDGLFETILAKNAELMLFDDHVARLRAGCAAMNLPAPDKAAVRELCELAIADAGAKPRMAVRLTLTAGSGGRGLDRPDTVEPHVFATAAPAVRPEEPATLVTSPVRRNEGSPTSWLKTLSYLDNVWARRMAAPDDALMLNNGGEICCATAANIFWVKDGKLYTPSLDCGVLDGVMRRRVMALQPVEEVRAPRAMLEQSDAVFLTSSLIGVRPVASLDGTPLRSHSMVDRFAAALAAVS